MQKSHPIEGSNNTKNGFPVKPKFHQTLKNTPKWLGWIFSIIVDIFEIFGKYFFAGDSNLPTIK